MNVLTWPNLLTALVLAPYMVLALSTSSLPSSIRRSQPFAFAPCLHPTLARSTISLNRRSALKASPSGSDDNDDGNFFDYKSQDDDENFDDKLPSAGGNFFSSQQSGGPDPTTPPQQQQQPPPKQEPDEPMTLEELEMLATPFDEHLPKLNSVTLVGRTGNSPEPKYFDDGKVVLNLSLAVKRKYHPLERKVRDISYGDEETDWFALEFWGRDAEYVGKYVEKGARIGITGSLVMDGWVDKMSGDPRRKAKIVVRHIDTLETRAEAELRKGGSSGGSWNRGGGGGNGGGGGKKYNDDDDDEGPSSAGTGGFFS